jgi:acyl-ACP thioesterase
MGEKIILRATAMPALKALYPWQFSFIDSDGNKIGEGSTLWNLMNAETRRIMVIPEIDAKIPRNAAGGAKSLPSPAKELETPARRQTLSPVYTDLDINGHASHLRYIDWCCNRLGHELMSKCWIKDFRISYMQEVRADQTVSTELRVDGQDFSFAGYDGATCCFVIDGTLASRT